MRRIGILGGTFDPVHNGHLLLGEQAYREYGLDEIWFMPSHVPPHKKDHLITDGAARIRMLELATESIPYFTVSDFEMGREGNTYTAQTLALLKEAYPDIEVYFIIGADSLYQLEFGALLMTVKATRVFYDLVPDGGMVDLVYEICIENTEAGIIDYHLDIRKK